MARGLFVVVALACCVAAVATQWSDIEARVGDLSAGSLLAAGLATGASLVCSFAAWRTTLGALGPSPPGRAAARIFFVGQLAKFVPGSVWALVGQMELGRAYGISRRQVGAAGLLVLAVSLTVALGLGTLAAPAVLDAGGPAYVAVLALALPLAALLHPRVLAPVLDRALARLRRPALERHLDGADVARVAALSLASNGLLGVQVWLLALDLGASGTRVLPLAIGGYALAASAALLIVFLPAGLGAREAGLVLALSPVLDLSDATLVAIASRLVMTLADVVAAVVATVVAARSAAPPAPPAPPGPAAPASGVPPRPPPRSLSS